MSRIVSADEILLNVISILQGTADPTAGLGVARSIGSLYTRDQAGSVALYLKTAAAATGWQKMVQSFGWKSVLDYGADPTGAVDSTTAFQSAINDVSAQSGGVVFVPYGTYLISQLTMSGAGSGTAVQLIGSGGGSVLKWTFNAGAAAGSMITVTAGAQRCVFENIRFDGSGLTNPDAAQGNHLIRVDGTGGGVIETHIVECWFGNMVAGAGDGVHIIGTAGNLVSRLWIRDCEFNGCTRYGVGIRQGWQYGWITGNYLTNCATEIAFESNASLNTDSIQVVDNTLIHTGTVRHALRMEGDATALITNLICAKNIIIGGFVTASNINYAQISGNPIFSGAYASADAVLRIFGAFSNALVVGNVVDRDPAASSGPCISAEKSTNAPTRFKINTNILVQEVATSAFVSLTDCTQCSVGANECRATNAGATTQFAIDVQAATVNIDLILVSNNQITAAAGTFKAAVRLLANGANVLGITIGANQANQIDSGAQFEIGGGGGNFTNNVILMAGNNFNAGTGDFVNVGGAGVVPRVGFNAGTTAGAQLFEGTGSPEGVVTARPGSMYLNTSGGQATSIYYKETGTGNTGWIGIGGSAIVFGAGDVTTAATAVFLAPGYIATAIATEIQLTVTRPGTIRNLRIQVAGAGTGAQTNTYTVRKNGVNTALLATISNTSTGGASDLADSFTVAAGDLLSLQCTKGAGVAAGQTNVIGTVELV